MAQDKCEYLAHTPSESGRVDCLKDHLVNVANRAEVFARVFDAGAEASLTGLLHDLGKYGDLFQRRLKGLEHGVDHWSLGAWVALTQYKMNGIAAALAIQGHHVGLTQAAPDALREINPAKLMKYHPHGLRLSAPDTESLLERFQADGLILPQDIEQTVYTALNKASAAGMLDVRMLYSALVDADFLETEAHFLSGPDGQKHGRPTGPSLDAEKALSCLIDRLQRLSRESTAAERIRRLRQRLLNDCLIAADLGPGLFTLTAPTGAGKTLSMLAFALKHAKQNGLRRIIAVIPYLTIIEQTAHEYRLALKKSVPSEMINEYILEHHSLTGTRNLHMDDENMDPDMEDESRRRVRLLAENWDAPIIVTTSVQFLESLFANRPTPCRKLHRLAKSVILFDEVQTLPTHLAIQTLATLSHLSEKYGATVVFSTATQPAFDHLDKQVRKFCTAGWRPQEVVRQPRDLFARSRRTTVRLPRGRNDIMTWNDLAQRLASEENRQVLCIVNIKRHAWNVLSRMKELEVPDLFHLSTNMCPSHRVTALDEVRRRLDMGAACRLISTQCVLAGVDVDFPQVFRALGPMEAIAQAAGRCNRNGLGQTDGVVTVFIPEEEHYPDAAYQQAAGVTAAILERNVWAGLEVVDPDLFTNYYRELYNLARPEHLQRELTEAVQRRDFQDVARQYRLIPDISINVLVPWDLKAYRRLADEVRATGLTRKWILRARPEAVSLFRPKHDDQIWNWLAPVPVSKGQYSEDWFIYLNEKHYDPLFGLKPSSSMEVLIA